MLTCFLTTLAVVATADFTIADRRTRIGCPIVLRVDASPSERYAADELSRWTSELTSVALPVVTNACQGPAIILEPGHLDGLGEDGFRLSVSGDRIRIVGGKRGILYGVYELLEAYGGIAWLTADQTHVPHLDAFKVPRTLNTTQKPAFQVREGYFYDARGNVRYDERCDIRGNPDFAARLRYNGNYNGLESRHGGVCGRYGKGMGHHSLDALLPVSKYGAAHPEYYCLRDGRRKTSTDGQFELQPCLTNPEVVREVTKNLLEAIARDPTAECFSVSQNDNMCYCECEQCASVDLEEGSHAGTMIRFVNAVAEEVEKHYPDKRVMTLAYQYTRNPPKTAPRKNVGIMFCTIDCDFAHSIRSGRHKENVAIRDDLVGWGRLTRNIAIWDYVAQFSAFQMPFANLAAEVDNIRFYRENGVSQLSEEGCYGGYGGDLEELRCWLLAKLMWNPDLDEFALVDEFCRGFYGKAAPYVRQYYDLLRACPRDDIDYKLDCCHSAFTHRELISDTFMKKALDLWEQASKAVKEGDWQTRVNVMKGSFGVTCTQYRRLAKESANVGFSLRKDGSSEEALDCVKLARRVKWLVDYADKHNWKIDLSEARDSREQFRKFRIELDKALDVKPVEPSASVKLEEDALSLCYVGKSCEIVKDETASGGKALRFMTDDWPWCASMTLPGSVFDLGDKYRFRARIRIAKKKDGVDNVAVNAGLYNESDRKQVAGWGRKASELKDGEWQWIDFGEFEPQRTQLLWFSSGVFDRAKWDANPAVEAVYVDAFEISRADVQR